MRIPRRLYMGVAGLAFAIVPAFSSPAVAALAQSSQAVSVTKTGPASAFAGDNITYTITAHNVSSSAVENVRLTDVLPAGLTFVSLKQTSGSSFSCNNTSTTTLLTCTAATLAAGGSANFELVAQTSASTRDGTKVSNSAIVYWHVVSSAPALTNHSSPAETTILNPGTGGNPGGGGPNPGATPELDSLLLLGSGLAGLAGYARLRFRGRPKN